MNEFDLLSAAINTAIKHGNHNQKLHGRRFGPDTGGAGSAGGLRSSADILGTDTKDLPLGDDNSDYAVSEEKYRTLGKLMTDSFDLYERKSIGLYQGEAYTEINLGLKGRVINEYARSLLKEHVPMIDSAMNKSIIPHDTVVYRGARISSSNLKNLTTTGNIINRPGYTSTTTSIDVAGQFAGSKEFSESEPDGRYPVIMHIKAPAGTKAIHMGNASDTRTSAVETELLIQRGIRMIVRGSRVQRYPLEDGGYEDVTHVDVEILP